MLWLEVDELADSLSKINIGCEHLEMSDINGVINNMRLTVGTGDYYCSGNDLSNLANVAPEDIPEMAKQGEVLFR